MWGFFLRIGCGSSWRARNNVCFGWMMVGKYGLSYLLHALQWCARGGFGAEHFRHHFLVIVFFLSSDNPGSCFSAQSFGILPGSTNTLRVYVMNISTRMTLANMSSFLVSGLGSSCVKSHCEGYPRKKISTYTEGTARCESSIFGWKMAWTWECWRYST